MTTKEVPTATLISIPSSRTNAGMIKKPPPTPNSPVRTPTPNPVGMDRGAHRRQLIPELLVLQAVPGLSGLRSMRAPARIMTIAKPIITAVSGRCLPRAVPARVPRTPVAAKIAASRHSMSRARTLEMTPTAEATPITNSEVGIASGRGNPRAYTRIGTARIDPPPPRRPSRIPTVRPSASARVNVINCALHPDCRACPGRLGVWWWPRPRHLTVLVRPSLGP